MNESTGGALLLNIVIIIVGAFIVIFAASFAYTKAYRAKSIIIDIIEEYNGIDQDHPYSVVSDIDAQLLNMGYRRENKKCVNKKGHKLIYPSSGNGNGYCIYQVYEKDNYGNGNVYYEVETYMYLDIPLINVSFPVYGQTVSFKQTMKNIE